MIKIAVLGYGVVGSGTVEIAEKNSKIIAKRLGEELSVKYILDRREFEGDPNKDKIVNDFQIILEDKEVSVVVEAMGGVEPAYSFAKASILAGKSVVTSNKAVVAVHGAELLSLARENKVSFLFEASVGGGIPVLRPMYTSFKGDVITEIAGILNGTTNFILSKMTAEGYCFDNALKMAQKLGYAEADPTDDVEGYDAARKIAILASLAFGKQLDYKDIYTEGVTKVSAKDNLYAKSIGGVIKLVARAKLLPNGKISAMVTPAIVMNNSQFATVNDVFNCVMVKGEMVGEVIFYGQGAGKLATASAMIADVMEAATIGNNPSLYWQEGNNEMVENRKSYAVDACVRFKDADTQLIEKVFPNSSKVNVEHMDEGEIAYCVGSETESELEEGLIKLEAEGVKLTSVIRILNY